MGEHMSQLQRLGDHVSGSLEKTLEADDAAARVRAKLARGDARAEDPRPRVRRSAIAGALALAAAAALVFFFFPRGSQRSALTFTIGGAGSGAVGAFLTPPPGRELPVAFSDGTSIRIAPGARARIASVSPRGAHLLVESGVIRADVVHRVDTEWLVDAGPFEVKVTGTRFDVAWEPADQAVVVTLHEGSVVVTGCTLRDGQRISAGQQLRASCKTGASTIGSIGEGASAEPGLTTMPATSLPDAPPEPSRPLDAPATPPASSAARLAIGSATPVAASVSAPAAATEPSASDLLARANVERYAGRFDAAAESLDTVRRRFRGSDAAASAAFELGRIAFDARHDFKAAGDWFDTYLRERPSGALAREALGRAIESRNRGGEAARAEQLATRYVAMYPQGPHSALARRLADRAGDRAGATP
jgi:transmembrane sensor